MISARSVKDRLKQQAIRERKSLQDKLVTFGLERVVYRISVSPYAERFTLKGGIFLYALFDGEYPRATIDVDLLADKLSNDTGKIIKVFKDIFTIKCDDAIKFNIDTLKVKSITEFKEYHGINVSIIGYLDNTKIPVSIDIGFGDVIYPDRVKIKFPVLLNMEEPEIYAYSICSVIAEKFEAFVSLGMINSRYKDFYDIYVLAKSYDVDGLELQNAIVQTFKHRETSFDNIVAFESGFVEDTIRKSRWQAFVKKKKTLIQVSFEETICVIKLLLVPIVRAIEKSIPYEYKWNHEMKKWE